MDELRIADAAFALGMSEDTLRNWLKLGKVTILTPYGGGWSTFTLQDIAHLCLARLFVDLGRRVEQANALAQMAAETVLSRPDDPDPSARWKGKLLCVTRERTDRIERWGLTVVEPGASYPGTLTIDIERELKPVIERALARIRERQEKAA